VRRNGVAAESTRSIIAAAIFRGSLGRLNSPSAIARRTSNGAISRATVSQKPSMPQQLTETPGNL
jgi:hypothetical protein